MRRRSQYPGSKIRHPLRALETGKRKTINDVKKMKNVLWFDIHETGMHLAKWRPSAVFQWLYSGSYFIFLIILLALSSAMPIDIIIQSSQTTSRLAINTLIIIGACALFVIISLTLYFTRLLIIRSHVQDIPKPYIPITSSDVPPNVASYIHDELERCQDVVKLSGPKDDIVHKGMYHYHIDSNVNNPVLPDNVIYENVVREIGEDIKYRRYINLDDHSFIPVTTKETLRQTLETLYRANSSICNQKDMDNLHSFLRLYQNFRFSGDPISYNDFIIFIGLWKQVRTTMTKMIH